MVSQMLAPLFEGPKNLSFGQRAGYIAAGLGMAAAAARPRPNPLLNVVALAAGSYLAWSGYRGRCPVKALVSDERRRLEGPEA
jgi:hypothetical protein